MACLPLPPVDGIVLHLTDKGDRQHTGQPAAPPVGMEASDADGHDLVPGARLCTVGAEQIVPPWQVEAEIAVGLVVLNGMVHSVHVRGNDEQPQQPV